MRAASVQHVPYVKAMLGGVMSLKRACSQAVQNKQRCVELAECAPLEFIATLNPPVARLHD